MKYIISYYFNVDFIFISYFGPMGGPRPLGPGHTGGPLARRGPWARAHGPKI